jgi:peptidoglycan/xylan/chitin deacetylase (PgdA/CDA1 family)
MPRVKNRWKTRKITIGMTIVISVPAWMNAWFRCPFGAGADDPRVLRAIASLGYRDIGADVSLEDWEPHRTGPAIVADALVKTPRHGDGAVVLFHSWPPGTLDAVPALIDGLRNQGATFVTLDELERFTAPDLLPTEPDAALAS